MQAGVERLGVAFSSLGGVLGTIFSINAALDSEWIGAGVCLIGAAAAFSAATYVARYREATDRPSR